MTTKTLRRVVRRQFLPLSRKQHELESRGRACWRIAPRGALFLRPPTPTGSRFSQADGAYVGASLLAEPCFFIRARQHGPVFPGLMAPLLAPCSPRNLVSSSGHANTSRFFPVCQCRCWRLAPLKAFALHSTTPTGRPESIPRRPAPLLAPCSRALFAPPASGTKKPAPEQQSHRYAEITARMQALVFL